MSGEIHDSFNRSGALGTADSGHVWTLQTQAPYDNLGAPITPGTSSFTLDGSYANGSSSSRMDIATIDHGTGNTTAEMTVVLGWPAGQGVGLVMRWDAAHEFWLFLLYRSLVNANGYMTFLQRWYTGPDTVDTVGSTSGVFSSGATGTATLQVTVSGTSISGTIVGVGGGQSTTSSFNQTATHHGIASYYAPTADIDSYLADGSPAFARWYVGMIRR